MTLIRELSILTFIFFVTFIIILPIVCMELGFSWYFVPSRVDKNTIDHENDLRVHKMEQTLKYLESISFSENLMERQRDITNKVLDFSIVVVSTSRRSNPHYLLQSAVRLMAEVQSDDRNSQIVLFNVDDQPELNFDAKFLSQFIKVVNRSSPLISDIFEKEKQDYVDAIQIGLQQTAHFVLIVEDDALAMSGILWRLRYILQWKMPWKWLRSGPQQWAFLKLYYPEKWQGFGNTEIPELILIGIFGGLCSMIFRQKITKSRRKLGEKMLRLWCLSGFLYFLLVAYTVGRAHWIEIRKFLPFLYGVSKDFGCCTPAVLFPSEEARYFMEFLNMTKCNNGYPLDFAFEDFTKSNGLKGLLVSPNLFTHIGFHSSLHPYDKDTREFKLLLEP